MENPQLGLRLPSSRQPAIPKAFKKNSFFYLKEKEKKDKRLFLSGRGGNLCHGGREAATEGSSFPVSIMLWGVFLGGG